jgi:ribosomal protein S12 methylthiotransferase
MTTSFFTPAATSFSASRKTSPAGRETRSRLKRKIGGREKVIIDEVGSGGAKGRSKGDAPQIDGTVHVRSHRPLRIGEIATVKIERADAYDLHGSVVGC